MLNSQGRQSSSAKHFHRTVLDNVTPIKYSGRPEVRRYIMEKHRAQIPMQTNVLKELKETRVSLKILDFVAYESSDQRGFPLNELVELFAISAKMILNKKERK